MNSTFLFTQFLTENLAKKKSWQKIVLHVKLPKNQDLLRITTIPASNYMKVDNLLMYVPCSFLPRPFPFHPIFWSSLNPTLDDVSCVSKDACSTLSRSTFSVGLWLIGKRKSSARPSRTEVSSAYNIKTNNPACYVLFLIKLNDHILIILHY